MIDQMNNVGLLNQPEIDEHHSPVTNKEQYPSSNLNSDLERIQK